MSLKQSIDFQPKFLKPNSEPNFILVLQWLVELKDFPFILSPFLLLIDQKYIVLQEILIEKHPIDFGFDR